MTPQTVVATANVRYTLPAAPAREALETVLAMTPDLVGLQEWNVGRASLLRETGSVGFVPDLGLRVGRCDLHTTPEYLWSAPAIGGCVVGALETRFRLIRCRARMLSPPGRAERPVLLGLEPARLATVGTYADMQTDRTVSLVSYHLVPGVQVSGRYRADRPELVRRHRSEVLRLQVIVDELMASGHVVHAVGDSNFDGLHLTGLTSAWDGRRGEPGTLGPRRKVDDVHGPGRASSVTLHASASDHKAVVAVRWDQ